ncbi:pyridoxamine 5'-phosphate oxidase-domain-containing protein [Diplogelasinospora grovesii]|uniref:Pyridoxamine 5'-phosphate oxidase-domain-containing protein n=1 Tax=Diplogelasinospora grovesii TaxID=303347 RepID=A0AAN6MY12_9PEZI|nr:pyridoxamine 5'-phosphate oxidase-domain-containing protein [Diplogelasinospora grovesii]
MTKLTTLVASCCTAAATVAASAIATPRGGHAASNGGHQYLFSNPPGTDDAAVARVPTSYESAVMGRRILALTPLGTLATVFPDDNDNSYRTEENRPKGLGGMPHGLMEYIADCESDNLGNPTMLAINIETSFKNIAAGSNVSLAVQWTPPYPPSKRIQSNNRRLLHSVLSYVGLSNDDNDDDDDEEHDTVPYSAANLPRFSLLGYVERIEGGDEWRKEGEVGARLASCFVDSHPDARFWLPGSRVHESHFVRLVVQQVYWIGGFGDRAYIGWIPVEEWRNVSRAEWEEVRLPGEKKGWKEWSLAHDL